MLLHDSVQLCKTLLLTEPGSLTLFLSLSQSFPLSFASLPLFSHYAGFEEDNYMNPAAAKNEQLATRGSLKVDVSTIEPPDENSAWLVSWLLPAEDSQTLWDYKYVLF